MNLRLQSLKSGGPGSCVVELVVGGETIVSTFEIDSRDGIATVASNPDAFRHFDGTAEEQREVVNLIAAFCRFAGP